MQKNATFAAICQYNLRLRELHYPSCSTSVFLHNISMSVCSRIRIPTSLLNRKFDSLIIFGNVLFGCTFSFQTLESLKGPKFIA